MAISFFTQSKENPAQIYIRIREGKFDKKNRDGIDAKAKTQYSINPECLKKGKIKQYPKGKGDHAETKKYILEKNIVLIELQEKLDSIKTDLTRRLNNRNDYEIINSKWLKKILNNKPENDIPEDITSYFDFYLEDKQTSLKPSTIKKMKVFKQRLMKYEDDKKPIYIREVNKVFANSLKRWCNKMGYAHNTTVKTLKVVLTVCNHAKENGIITHPDLSLITKNIHYKNIEHIHLDFSELKEIEIVNIKDEFTDIARDWLIISCYSAQRVSDFLRFSKSDIKKMEGMYFLDISQEKTGKPVYIPLSDEVIKILDKRDGEFPPIFSKNIESNKAIYNRLIKDVCKIAKIKNLVTAQKRNKETNRYELKEFPKYKAVSTHIGRRSFATNYYGKINTALLIAATGHATERNFLRYVQKTGNENALSLAKEMRKFALQQGKEPELEVIRNVSNQ